MKKKTLLIFLLAAISSLSVSAAVACSGEKETPDVDVEQNGGDENENTAHDNHTYGD